MQDSVSRRWLQPLLALKARISGSLPRPPGKGHPVRRGSAGGRLGLNLVRVNEL